MAALQISRSGETGPPLKFTPKALFSVNLVNLLPFAASAIGEIRRRHWRARQPFGPAARQSPPMKKAASNA